MSRHDQEEPRRIERKPSLLQRLSLGAIEAIDWYEAADHYLIYLIGVLVLVRWALTCFSHGTELWLEVVRLPLEGAEWLTVGALVCGVVRLVCKKYIGFRSPKFREGSWPT